jgi:excinuclease ABC subunit B
MDFKIKSDFKPTGDQPEAIKQLVEGLKNGLENQTLLGVTGSGKTFTIANVIEQTNRPALILSHNKTLAAQLYGEFKNFFPDNRVEYYVSYYDYYQPEAYLPTSDTFIEKDLQINQEIEKLRLSASSALMSGRKDVIVISSVSCIYGIGNPEDFHKSVVTVNVGMKIGRNDLLFKLVDNLYSRTEVEFTRGTFRVRGDTIDIFLAYDDIAIRLIFWDDEIEEIYSFDPINTNKIENLKEISIYPANLFVTSKEKTKKAVALIQDDLYQQVNYYKEIGKHLEAKRLDDRVSFDLEMIKEVGHCSGIENYSRYFDGREPGTRPFCLLDFFPDDFLMIIDESHVTLPQVRAMYGGDRSRKENLVEYGFRLPAAMDNRPLKFDEFENIIKDTIYVSATPADYEIEKSEGIIVEQVIRPTGLLDPAITVKPSLNQIDDLMEEISVRVEKDERILVTTLTKRMAEELTKYLEGNGTRCKYIHSDVDTLDRVEILDDLRAGRIDVLIGVNLLREGLDLPEVSLVAILDADKEGFLRSARSLTQTAGRAARHLDGRVIMYADKITRSMKATIDATDYRREKQIKYNLKNNITPTQIVKSLKSNTLIEKKTKEYYRNQESDIAADPIIQYMTAENVDKTIAETERKMYKAAKELNFLEAAALRDELDRLREFRKNKSL